MRAGEGIGRHWIEKVEKEVDGENQKSIDRIRSLLWNIFQCVERWLSETKGRGDERGVADQTYRTQFG